MAVGQSQMHELTHCYREQAPSHSLISMHQVYAPVSGRNPYQSPPK